MKEYPLNQLEHYKIWGRTNESLQPLPLFWTGSGIELNISGKELWLDVEVSYDAFEPWIAININGAFISRRAIPKGRHKICIYTNSDPSVKNIFIYKETQPFHEDAGHFLCIHGFTTDGQFFPIESRPYRLEFIGDSISSGEGTYGAVTEEAWLPMFMSASKNYAVMTSRMLNAEYRILSQSGWGVHAGWDDHTEHNLPDHYEQICSIARGEKNANAGCSLPYDFTSWKPDAIIINLGTNDAAALSHHLNAADSFLEEISFSVKKFLHMIRKNNPTARIIWIYGMLGNDIEGCIRSAISEYNTSRNDNVLYYPLPCTPADELGSRRHPGEKMHQRTAELLSDYLISLLSSSETK